MYTVAVLNASCVELGLVVGAEFQSLLSTSSEVIGVESSCPRLPPAAPAAIAVGSFRGIYFQYLPI